MTLKSFEGNGVEVVSETLLEVEKLADKKTSLKAHYLGAPAYYLELTSSDHKSIDKKLDAVERLIEQSSKKHQLEFALQRQKK